MAEPTKHANITAALVAARAEFPPILKDSTNPHFKNKFASLDSILSAVVPVLTKHGLVVVQPIRGHCIETTLLHMCSDPSAGVPLDWRSPVFGSIHSSYPLPECHDEPQKFGAAIMYGRRYSLCALLGVVAEDDDDGNRASAPRAAAATPAANTTDERKRAAGAFWGRLTKEFGDVHPFLKESDPAANPETLNIARYKRLALKETFGTTTHADLQKMPDAAFMQMLSDNLENAIDVAKKAKQDHDEAMGGIS